MGSKKIKTKQSNRPIYSGQIEGAAGGINDAYNRQQPVINNYADQLSGVSDDLFARYREGDPTTQAAQGFLTNLFSQDQSNPYLDDMVARTNTDLQDRIRTQMGTRGGLGGSDELGIIGDALSRNELNLRYSDYDNMMQRRLQGASLVPSLAATELLPLDAAMKTGSQGALLPLNAANARGAGIGGLLGQYQNVEGEQRTKPGFFDWAGLGLQTVGLFA